MSSRHFLALFLLLAGFGLEAEAASPAPVLLHTFVSGGKPVGYLYGYREGTYADVYSGLEVRSSASAEFEVWYRIGRHGLFLGDGTLDLPLQGNRSHGFTVADWAPDRVRIECCRIGTIGSRPMSAIGVRWDQAKGRFAAAPEMVDENGMLR